MSIKLKVPNITCEHCKMRIEKALKTLDSVQSISVDIIKKTVEVTGDVDSDKVKTILLDIGYESTEIK